MVEFRLGKKTVTVLGAGGAVVNPVLNFVDNGSDLYSIRQLGLDASADGKPVTVDLDGVNILTIPASSFTAASFDFSADMAGVESGVLVANRGGLTSNILQRVVESFSATITVTTEPTADGLTSATAGETPSAILGRLANTGAARTDGDGNVQKETVLLDSNGDVLTSAVVEGTVLSYRVTFTATGAVAEVRTVALNITVAAAAAATIPGKVTNLTLAPLDSALDATWSVASDGGSPITGYRLEVDGVTVTIGTDQPYTITGLTNGVQASVRIRAQNAIGNGAWSEFVLGTPAISEASAEFAVTMDGADYEATGVEENEIFYIDLDGDETADFTTTAADMADLPNGPRLAISPSLTSDALYVGGEIVVDPGAWSYLPPPRGQGGFTVTWELRRSDNTLAASGTSSADVLYTIVAADENETLTLTVTADDDGANGPVTETATIIVPVVENLFETQMVPNAAFSGKSVGASFDGTTFFTTTVNTGDWYWGADILTVGNQYRLRMTFSGQTAAILNAQSGTFFKQFEAGVVDWTFTADSPTLRLTFDSAVLLDTGATIVSATLIDLGVPA